MKDLKSLADEAKLSVGSGVVAIVGIDGDGKAGIVVGVTPDLTGRFDAVQLVRPAAVKLGGKGGGGRPRHGPGWRPARERGRGGARHDRRCAAGDCQRGVMAGSPDPYPPGGDRIFHNHKARGKIQCSKKF